MFVFAYLHLCICVFVYLYLYTEIVDASKGGGSHNGKLASLIIAAESPTFATSPALILSSPGDFDGNKTSG